MCWRSASDYDLYARTISRRLRPSSKPERTLVEVLRDLIRPRRPQVAQAEVVPFPAGAAVGTGNAVDRKGSKAA